MQRNLPDESSFTQGGIGVIRIRSFKAPNLVREHAGDANGGASATLQAHDDPAASRFSRIGINHFDTKRHIITKAFHSFPTGV